MANIVTTKRIKNGTTLVSDTIYAYEQQSGLAITGDDVNVFTQNGEFVMDFGGEIKNASNVTLAILPKNNRKVPSQLAFSQQFPSSQYTNAQAVRDAYKVQIEQRLLAGVQSLRDKNTANNTTNSITF
jgi:hypothetical protein